MRDLVTLALLALAAVAWLVSLGGVAALTAESMPAWATGYSWWTLWFQFFLIAYSVVVSLMGSASKGAAQLRTYLMLMVTVQWTQVANSARVAVDAEPLRGKLLSATQAQLAGAILTLAANFLLIIYWGLTDHGQAALPQRKASPDADNEAVPTPPAKAEPVTVATV